MIIIPNITSQGLCCLVFITSCHTRETRVRAQTPSHVQAHVDTLTIAADGETDPDMCVRW